MSPSDCSSPLRLCSPKQTKGLISYFKSGLFISQAKTISQFLCVQESSQNDKNTWFDDNFQKAKNILLKPLLLKFIYSERQSLELRPLSPSGGGGWGAGWVEYCYCIGYGFLTPFGLKPFRCEIGLGLSVPKSGSGFFLSDTNPFVIIRVLDWNLV